MEASLPLSWGCGAVRGSVTGLDTRISNRMVCYCRDCQAFAHFLGKPETLLDEFGGSDIVQVSQGQVHIEQGLEHIACVNLTDGNLLRWYTSCCNTPIGNAPAGTMPFVGLLKQCLDCDESQLDQAVGPVQGYVFDKWAASDEAPRGAPMLRVMGRFLRIILVAKYRGDRRRSPFFDPDSGLPIHDPQHLSAQEREAVYSRVDNRKEN